MEESGWCSLIYHMGVGATQAVWLTIHQNYIFLLWPAWFLSQITLCSVNHINTRRRARLGRQLGNWEAAQIGATPRFSCESLFENLNYAKLHKTAKNNCSHLHFITLPGDIEAVSTPLPSLVPSSDFCNIPQLIPVFTIGAGSLNIKQPGQKQLKKDKNSPIKYTNQPLSPSIKN